MAALTNMLVLSAIVASMSLPTTKKEDVEMHAQMLKNAIIKHETQPITVDSKPPIVWFVKDNNKTNSIEKQGTANEMYTITDIPTKEDEYKVNQNIPVLDLKDEQIIENKNEESISLINLENKEESSGIKYYEGTRLLSEKKPIAITEDLLAFTLIKPNYNFPEANKATDIKENISLKNDKLGNTRPFLKHQDIYAYAVGPALYPQSIYRREFSVPFFE